jgi:hypothetical protein
MKLLSSHKLFPKNGRKLSWFTVWILTFILIALSFQDHKWTQNRVIIHDVTGYYSYLPALFIYGDMEMSYRHALPKDQPIEGIWVNIHEEITYLKAPIGLSYFYLPSFWVAHAIALKSPKFEPNGYSRPYQLALAFNTLIISILCLFICRHFLLYHFSDSSVALALSLLYGGSNLYYYVTMAPAMAHPYGMFLIACMLILTHRFYRNGRRVDFLLLAIVLGWAISVRPTNAILVLFPLLYGLHPSMLHRLKELFAKRKLWLLWFAIVFAIPILPQLIYWKALLGNWIVYSYDTEQFFFTNPHVWDGYFSFRKGFFLYTPMMIFAFIGLFMMRKRLALALPLIAIIPIFSFVVFSWWCWWYGGHSSRALIEMYPFLLLGFASFSEFLLKGTIWKRLIIGPMLIFCVWLNLRFTDLYERGIIHWDSMTRGNYQAVFWNNDLPENYFDMFEEPDFEKAKKEGE